MLRTVMYCELKRCSFTEVIILDLITGEQDVESSSHICSCSVHGLALESRHVGALRKQSDRFLVAVLDRRLLDILWTFNHFVLP